MNLTKAIAELHEERQNIEEAMQVLTRLAAAGGRRRGRPPKWMAEGAHSKPTGRLLKNPDAAATVTAPPRGQRKGMSAAARKAQSGRMKKYWATRRKEKANA